MSTENLAPDDDLELDPAPAENPGPDYLAMSDEDILKMGAPAAVVPEASPQPEPAPAETPDPDETPAPPEAAAPAPAADADDKDDADPAVVPEAPATAPAADVDKAKPAEQAPAEAPAPDAGKAPEAAPAIDYKAEYEKLTAPFKANGRELSVKSVDDAIALMQMGANYNKKMAALKPNLKLMKLLENNGLLSEEKISFLIDLEKKNPDAINKLVKDSGINPMDLDADKASAYRQSTYTVDDREIELDTVLDEIQDSPTYTRTLDVVGNKWDSASKQMIAQAPDIIKVIDGHMQSGVYDLIVQEVESERLFGRLKGLSDLEAYRKVGDAIHARGGFNHLAPAQSAAAPAATGKPAAPAVIVPPKPAAAEDDKLKEKRRAASPTRPAAPNPAAASDFNPLAMSDEEFSKHVHSKFLT